MADKMGKAGITIYDCDEHEADLFRKWAAHYGVELTFVASPVSAENAASASGHRSISVNHKSKITFSTLRALKENGVAYISTRSVGCNHIDTEAAEKLGIAIGNVAYSPASVADYTLMLMLMSIRNAKSVLRRTDVHNYRLCAVPGRELRDMTVGIVDGTRAARYRGGDHSELPGIRKGKSINEKAQDRRVVRRLFGRTCGLRQIRAGDREKPGPGKIRPALHRDHQSRGMETVRLSRRQLGKR
jgi:hypothetical protein